jgi:hypothetical protein
MPFFMTLFGLTTPTILLILTFALGAGTTMIRTPIIPTMSGLVPRSELPDAAMALESRRNMSDREFQNLIKKQINL